MSSAGSSHSETIDLANVVRTTKRGWRAVIVCTLLGALAAAAIVKYAPPKYVGQATMVMRVAKERGGLMSQLAGLGDAGGVLGGGLKGALETESRILSSRAVLGEVVDSLRLQARIVMPRRVPTINVISGLALEDAFKKVRYTFTRQAGKGYAIEGNDFHATFDSGATVTLPVGRVTFSSPSALPPEFVLELRDREDAIDRVFAHLTIGKPGGELIHVIYSGDDSLSAPRIANTVVSTYFSRRITTDRGANHELVDFISKQMDSLGSDLARAEQALRREQEASGVLDAEVFGKVQLERGSALREALTQYALEEATLKALVERVRSGNASVQELSAFPSFLKSPAINALITELTTIETKRFQLLEERTATDRGVLAFDSAAKNIQSKLLPMATTYLAATSQQRAGVEATLDTLLKAVATLPATAEKSMRLQRDVATMSKTFGLLMTELQSARMDAIHEGGDVRMMDAAYVPKRVAFPRPIVVYPAGVGGGLLVGIVVAVMIGLLGRWVQDPYDVERTTGVPTLTFDPHAPLLVGTRATKTVLVAPLDQTALAAPVVERLAQTAISRSLKATVLDLSLGSEGADINAMIARLELDHDLVVVQLPGLVSDEAAAALRENRPVLLVTPERKVDRSRLAGAVQLLRRLDVPCAGIVMSGGNGRVNGNGRPRVTTAMTAS